MIKLFLCFFLLTSAPPPPLFLNMGVKFELHNEAAYWLKINKPVCAYIVVPALISAATHCSCGLEDKTPDFKRIQ